MSLGLHIDRVGALIEDKQWDLARVMSQSGLRLYPDTPELLRMSLIASYRLGDLYEALESSRHLITLSEEPRDLYNFGTLALEFNRASEARAALERVVDSQPEHLSARANLLAAYCETGDLDRAIELSRNVDVGRHPASTVANFVCNLATVYRDAGEPGQAMGLYGHAMALCEGWHPVAASNRLYAANFAPSLSSAEIESLHCEWGAQIAQHIGPDNREAMDPTTKHERPRIAFLSGDFRRHSVAYFLEPVWEVLRQQVDLIAVDNSPHHDEVTDRLRELASGWVTIRGLDDLDAARSIRAQDIDMLVDLSGHTAHNRLPLMARRLAPKQLSYLGYPNTTGLETVDARIVDSWCDPQESSWRGPEHLLRSDLGFLAYRGPTCELVRSKRGAGLTFGSFNTPAKVNSQILNVWAEALKAHPSARLVLKNKAYGAVVVQSRIKKTLATAGVDPGRIDFRVHTRSLKDHLETYNEVDVALDTYPYQGTTTTCEALFMGVPVVSLCGDRHASRVSNTLAHQAGEDWVRCSNDTQTFVEQVSAVLGQEPRPPRIARLGADASMISTHASSIAASLLDFLS